MHGSTKIIVHLLAHAPICLTGTASWLLGRLFSLAKSVKHTIDNNFQRT